MAKETTLAHDISEKDLNESAKMIEKNSRIIETITRNIVQSYTKPLDDVMNLCRDIFNSEIPASDQEIEDLVLRLPATLYFTGEGQEAIGIKEDISKAVKTEVFNKARQDASGTVADKDSLAEMASANESINNIIYQRAYKMIKLRMEAGYEQLNAIKKIMNRREMEYQLGRVDPMRFPGNRQRGEM